MKNSSKFLRGQANVMGPPRNAGKVVLETHAKYKLNKTKKQLRSTWNRRYLCEIMENALSKEFHSTIKEGMIKGKDHLDSPTTRLSDKSKKDTRLEAV